MVSTSQNKGFLVKQIYARRNKALIAKSIWKIEKKLVSISEKIRFH